MEVTASAADHHMHVLDQVFRGNQQIISHRGLSQFSHTSTGQSTCGLAAVNCVRLVFDKENSGCSSDTLLQWLLSPQGTEEILSICALWTDPSHLDVEEIVQLPVFKSALILARPAANARCSLGRFRKLLKNMEKSSRETSSAVVITKPPEIVACIKIPSSKGNIFIVFDSHIRANHQYGAGFIVSSSLDETARYLSDLFKVDDIPSTTGRHEWQWQVDMMRQFCGHILVSKKPSGDEVSLTRTLLESSIKILMLERMLADLRATKDNSSLKNENASLKEENISLKNELAKANQRFSYTSGRYGEYQMAHTWDHASNRHGAQTASSSSFVTDETRDFEYAMNLQKKLAREAGFAYVCRGPNTRGPR